MGIMFKRRKQANDFAFQTSKAKIECAGEIYDWCAAAEDSPLPPRAVVDFLARVTDVDDTWIHKTVNSLPPDLLERVQSFSKLVIEAILIHADDGGLNDEQALQDAYALQDLFPEAEPPFQLHDHGREHRQRCAADSMIAQGLMLKCSKDAFHGLAHDDPSWNQTVVVAMIIWGGWLISSERQSIPKFGMVC